LGFENCHEVHNSSQRLPSLDGQADQLCPILAALVASPFDPAADLWANLVVQQFLVGRPTEWAARAASSDVGSIGHWHGVSRFGIETIKTDSDLAEFVPTLFTIGTIQNMANPIPFVIPSLTPQIGSRMIAVRAGFGGFC
jgi:hypothetical protein